MPVRTADGPSMVALQFFTCFVGSRCAAATLCVPDGKKGTRPQLPTLKRRNPELRPQAQYPKDSVSLSPIALKMKRSCPTAHRARLAPSNHLLNITPAAHT